MNKEKDREILLQEIEEKAYVLVLEKLIKFEHYDEAISILKSIKEIKIGLEYERNH